jgi:hypothetical protein
MESLTTQLHPSRIRENVRTWILDVLADREDGCTLDEIRKDLWSRIPTEIRQSWVIVRG